MAEIKPAFRRENIRQRVESFCERMCKENNTRGFWFAFTFIFVKSVLHGELNESFLWHCSYDLNFAPACQSAERCEICFSFVLETKDIFFLRNTYEIKQQRNWFFSIGSLTILSQKALCLLSENRKILWHLHAHLMWQAPKHHSTSPHLSSYHSGSATRHLALICDFRTSPMTTASIISDKAL